MTADVKKLHELWIVLMRKRIAWCEASGNKALADELRNALTIRKG